MMPYHRRMDPLSCLGVLIAYIVLVGAILKLAVHMFRWAIR